MPFLKYLSLILNIHNEQLRLRYGNLISTIKKQHGRSKHKTT